MAERILFRNIFNAELVTRLAGNISAYWPDFDQQNFINDVIVKFDDLSFGDRCRVITDELGKQLPTDFKQACNILVNSLEPETDDQELKGYDGFIIMPQCQYIARFGLDDIDTSLNALYEMTKRFTAEGEIRVFIKRYPEETMKFLNDLTEDSSPFARRLASEGTRPRLPLSTRLPEFQKNPDPVFEILEKLKCDSNRMVLRSVANNLNDISKDNPDKVISTLKKWIKIENEGTKWLIRHGLRTLLKEGNPGAMGLLGFDPKVSVSVGSPEIASTTIKNGDQLEFSVRIDNQENYPVKLMIDYIIYFQKKNGTLAPKVFKASQKTLRENTGVTIAKNHSFQETSTRVLYPGLHQLEIQVNGQRYGRVDFELA